MLERLRQLVPLLAVACGAPLGGAGRDAGTYDGGPAVRTLGLNDVTMLAPLPVPPAIALLRAVDKADDGTDLIPSSLYDMLNNPPLPRGEPGPVLFARLADFQVLAVRFDLCDRVVPGPCPDSDGRLRLVFQPARVAAIPPDFADAGLHAFYVIPKAELPAVVLELRALSRIQNADRASPLRVNAALTSSSTGEYATRLKRLITKYAGTSSLRRLTLLAQPDTLSQVTWVLRGVEQQNGVFSAITIPSVLAGAQQVSGARASFQVMPVADQPAGFLVATSEMQFAAAPPASRRQALESLAAVDNPLLNTPSTVQCASCHIATHALGYQASVAAIDPLALTNRYRAPAYDLTVPPLPDRTLRALGWAGTMPLIAQRTANESAQVATEMDARFPP